jgi:cytochrome c-type protein NapB
MKTLRLVILVAFALVAACSDDAAEQVVEVDDVSGKTESAPRYDDEGLGIRSQTVFDETGVEPPLATFPVAPPGTSTRLPRAYPGAPPQIPHSTLGLLPITKQVNACTGCHMPAVAPSIRATPIPQSHMNGGLSNARYNCSQCHVPQAEIVTVVGNSFESS